MARVAQQVDVRHHFVDTCAGRNLARPPHDARHPPAAFEARTFLAAERHGAGVGIGILPGAVVGRDDDDRVGRLGADGIHDPADVVVQFQHRIRVVAELRLARELPCAGLFGLCIFMKLTSMKNGLVVLGVRLDVVDGRIGLPDVEVAR